MFPTARTLVATAAVVLAGCSATGTAMPPTDGVVLRTTDEGVEISNSIEDFQGMPSLEARADGPDGSGTAIYLPMPLDPMDEFDLIGWAGDGTTAIFALATTPNVAEVWLERDGQTVDQMAPDTEGVASLGGLGEPSQFTIRALDASGKTIATCARDPEFDSLFLCGSA